MTEATVEDLQCICLECKKKFTCPMGKEAMKVLSRPSLVVTGKVPYRIITKEVCKKNGYEFEEDDSYRYGRNYS